MVDRKSTRLNSSHTVIYTLSLHDALPIYFASAIKNIPPPKISVKVPRPITFLPVPASTAAIDGRSEEHTSELQSHSDLHSFPTRRSSDLFRFSHQEYPAPKNFREGAATYHVPACASKHGCYRW